MLSCNGAQGQLARLFWPNSHRTRSASPRRQRTGLRVTVVVEELVQAIGEVHVEDRSADVRSPARGGECVVAVERRGLAAEAAPASHAEIAYPAARRAQVVELAVLARAELDTRGARAPQRLVPSERLGQRVG